VLTASDRAVRAITRAYHRGRRGEGLSAWAAPTVLDWQSFTRREWEARAFDGRLILNSTQEQAIWAAIAGEDRHLATLLEGSRLRLAALAMEAHGLLCSFAPRLLHSGSRAGWEGDAGAFSGWLSAFEGACRAGRLLAAARLPLELIPLLAADSAARPPILLAGFDRILPTQREVFDAWGSWQEASQASPASRIHFYQGADDQAELAACALWSRQQLAANPAARLLVVTQDVKKRRGEIERSFLKEAQFLEPGDESSRNFEFSLGVPLSRVTLPASAYLLLRWLTGPLSESDLDWLLSTDHAAANPDESLSLQSFLRALRLRGLQRIQWTLAGFTSQRSGARRLPAGWVERMTAAQLELAGLSRQPKSPVEWAEIVPKLLESAGWASARPLSSAEFQAFGRWQQALETTGSLGFDGRRIGWVEFLSALRLTLDETLFAPESTDAPIQIAGPAESAGLTADAIWFLGADEKNWPATGIMNPLVPAEAQRAAGMPHASAQLDWDLAGAMTNRLLASAPEVHFSFASQTKGVEARPSALVVGLTGAPLPLPHALVVTPSPSPATELFEDGSKIPFPPGKAAGGAAVLSYQSQCPFKAFAATRLGAQSWEPAQAGLTPSQRGQLLHAVLHSIWAGPPLGIRTSAELTGLADLRSFVAGHVGRVLARDLTAAMREQMARRYLVLEEMRLTGLVTDWLGYEAARLPFAVAATEVDTTVAIAGLCLKLRLDRVDRLNDGTYLVVDYKSGDVYPKSWELPRPEDVQLPLYAGFGLGEEEELGGLVFAKVRPGAHAFVGKVGDAAATLFEGLKGNSTLVKNALTAEELMDWRDCIEQLAKDYLAGKAQVDPRDEMETCERCGLQTVCRVRDSGTMAAADEEDDAVSATERTDD